MNEKQPTAGETAIQKFDYEGSAIAFANGKEVMVNASQMARKFGKKTTDWLRLKSTKDFLTELEATIGTDQNGDSRLAYDQGADSHLALVQVVHGGKKDEHGTWMHEDVALEFARWLSPKFAIWCNARIKELVRTGFTTAAPQPEARTDMEVVAEAFRILTGQVEERDQRIAQLEAENTRMRNIISHTAPAVTYTFTEVANALGFRRVVDFLNWAVDKGILIRSNGRCVPSAQYADRGFFWHREGRSFNNPYETKSYTVVSEKGLDMFAEELAAYNAEEGGEL